jgi:hypothetical protein
LPEWDTATWITAIGVVVASIGVVVAILAWLKPSILKPALGDLRVEVSNIFPVFDQIDGSQTLGDLLIGVTLRNGTEHSVKVTGWGVQLPGGDKVVVMRPTTVWEPRLPHWVPASDEATWHFDPDEIRRISAERGAAFKKMRAYVGLADGRTVWAAKGVPLA